MQYVIIYDSDIIAINIGIKEHESANVIYKDKRGIFHTIDFSSCSLNFKNQNNNSSEKCIGERNIVNGYFIFYTSGIKTKIVFKKKYVTNVFNYHVLTGSKNKRFHSLNNLINLAGFTTYDLT